MARVKKAKSWANTKRTYFGNDVFQIRIVKDGEYCPNEDAVRFHFSRKVIRERDEYFAVDIPLKDIEKALQRAKKDVK